MQNYLNNLKNQQLISNNLTLILNAIIKSGVEISTLLENAGIGNQNILGSAETENVQGETQKKLDVISNEIMQKNLLNLPCVAGIASEELNEPIINNNANLNGDSFFVLFDPLDGSSNIDINAPVGTIFSVLKNYKNNAKEISEQDFLQAGNQQVMAGYLMYSSSTQLVFTLQSPNFGVNAFTLNKKTGEFLINKANFQIPQDTKEFAINASNQRFWQPQIQEYFAELLQGTQGKRQKDFNMRWLAAMVADVHRVLSRGGVFLYPQDSKMQKKGLGGKLRLMYEANPMALLIKNAGGRAINGKENILDVTPEKLHQRISVILGSKNEIDYIQEKFA